MNDIIQEIRNGNKAAVKAVYQKYAKDVYNFAKSITGEHDSALFATKKTFSVLFNNIKRGDEPANLRTAALKIAYDEAYNAATTSKAANISSDASTSAYAESESPANKTYLKNKNVENDSYDNYSNAESVEYDSYEDAYNSRPRTSAKRQQRVPEPSYNNYNYEQDDYNDYDQYDAPKNSRGKNNANVYNAFDDEDQYDDYDYGYDDKPKKKKHRNKGLFVFCIIINVILILLLLWFLFGLLVNLGILPNIDLGYTWFNDTIYPLF